MCIKGVAAVMMIWVLVIIVPILIGIIIDRKTYHLGKTLSWLHGFKEHGFLYLIAYWVQGFVVCLVLIALVAVIVIIIERMIEVSEYLYKYFC